MFFGMNEAGLIGLEQSGGHGVSSQNVILHHDQADYEHDAHSEKNVRFFTTIFFTFINNIYVHCRPIQNTNSCTQ